MKIIEMFHGNVLIINISEGEGTVLFEKRKREEDFHLTLEDNMIQDGRIYKIVANMALNN